MDGPAEDEPGMTAITASEALLEGKATTKPSVGVSDTNNGPGTASAAAAEAAVAPPLQVLPLAPTIDLISGRDCTCILLHVHHSGIPTVLRKLLESDSLYKVGPPGPLRISHIPSLLISHDSPCNVYPSPMLMICLPMFILVP